MRLARDGWLSDTLAFDVFRVDDAASPADEESAVLVSHMARQSKALYYAKLDTCAPGGVATLSRLGFNVVDVNVTFAATPSEVVPGASMSADVDVAWARDEDRGPVLDVAGSCFRYSRFHLDPLLTTAAAHHVKRQWVASYFDRSRGDRLFVARARGHIAGFLAAVRTTHEHDTAAVIDLVGVAGAYQRSGVGRALVSRFAAHYAACAQLMVGTQAANVPSIRLYEGLGFRTIRSAYVLHRHVDANRT